MAAGLGEANVSEAKTGARARVPVWLLGSMTLSGTLGIHIFAPALVVAAQAFGARNAELQLGISLYIWGLAFGQLVHGPLSDRFGRRPVLIAGSALFTLASLIAATAFSASFFNLCRFAQALGGSAGMVIARTIVRDVSTQEGSTGSLAKLNLMILVGPGLGPVIGGFLVTHAGWQSILILLGMSGALNTAAIVSLLPETSTARSATTRSVLGNYARLVTSGHFAAYAIGGGCVTTGWYAFLSAAPLIYQQRFGLTPDASGMHLGVVVAGAWIGSFTASRQSQRWSAPRMLALGCRLSLGAAFGLLAAFLSGLASPVLVTGLMFLFTCGVGLAGPAALALATSVDPAAFGSASGLYGAIQMAVGALAAAGASFGRDGAITAIAILIGCEIAALCLFAGRARRIAKASVPCSKRAHEDA